MKSPPERFLEILKLNCSRREARRQVAHVGRSYDAHGHFQSHPCDVSTDGQGYSNTVSKNINSVDGYSHQRSSVYDDSRNFSGQGGLVPITPAAITTAALFHLSPTMIRAIVKSTGALVLIPTAVLDTTIPTMIQEITDATGVTTMAISVA